MTAGRKDSIQLINSKAKRKKRILKKQTDEVWNSLPDSSKKE